MSYESISQLINNINRWLVKDGLVFITAFLVDDPSYAGHAAANRQIIRNSFQGDDGQIFTYLEKNEIFDLFKGYSIIHHEEGMGPIHRHGGSKPHQHAQVKAVLRK